MHSFVVKLQDGKIEEKKSQSIRNLLTRIGNAVLEITIDEYKEKRSNPQNRYYWKVLVGGIKQMLNDMGNEFTQDEVHEYIKRYICPDICEYTKEVGGETIMLYSTKHLTTEQHSQLAERVRGFAARQGVSLGMPGEEV